MFIFNSTGTGTSVHGRDTSVAVAHTIGENPDPKTRD